MKGKVALITGGTGGIGRASALAFAQRGAKVVITGRRKKEGEETLQMINSAGGEGLFLQVDVSKEDDCKLMVDSVLKKFGRLDYAFNNAGIEGNVGPLVEESVENFHKVMDINVLGVLLSMKYEIPAIRNSGKGAIVNNASVAGSVGLPGVSTYVASKHAVLGLTRTAALEHAKENIRVCAVSPGAIETDMYSRFTADNEDTRKYLASLHPLGRTGSADEIAKTVVFLCSDDASFITGANLLVDGGFTAQ